MIASDTDNRLLPQIMNLQNEHRIIQHKMVVVAVLNVCPHLNWILNKNNGWNIWFIK